MLLRLLAKLHAFLCCVDTGKEVDIFSLSLFFKFYY